MFSHDTRYCPGVRIHAVGPYEIRAAAPGSAGPVWHRQRVAATFAVAAEEGGSVATPGKSSGTRRTARSSTWTTFSPSNTSSSPTTPTTSPISALAHVGPEHLSVDLDYAGKDALDLNGGTVKRACANIFQVKSIDCSANATIEVYGKHRLLPGDIVQLEGIDAADAVSDATIASDIRHEMNRQHVVHALPVDAGTSLDRVDWASIWDASLRGVGREQVSDQLDHSTLSSRPGGR